MYCQAWFHISSTNTAYEYLRHDLSSHPIVEGCNRLFARSINRGKGSVPSALNLVKTGAGVSPLLLLPSLHLFFTSRLLRLYRHFPLLSPLLPLQHPHSPSHPRPLPKAIPRNPRTPLKHIHTLLCRPPCLFLLAVNACQGGGEADADGEEGVEASVGK